MISPDAISKHIEEISKIGCIGVGPEYGYLRAPWSKEESRAMDYFKKAGEELGLTAKYDQVGNLFISTPDEKESVLQVGSHLDTVPAGGLYDGGAGIIAGFEAIKEVLNSNKSLKTSLELVIWRGEESATFNSLYMGSRAAFGVANPEFLKNSYNGQTLKEAISGAGFDPEFIKQSKPTLTEEKLAKVKAHIELHIEQATKLERDNLDIGIITSIRAPKRYRIKIFGESAHSGATPMDLKYRKDAVLTASYINVRLNEAILKEIKKGADLVQTVGVLNSDKDFNEKNTLIYDNAITKVSPFAYFYLDVRGNKKKELDAYTDCAKEIIEQTATEFGTKVEIELLSEADPVEELCPSLQEKISSASKSLDLGHTLMPSGAGHDAAVVARNSSIPTAMIFIPCRDGISHNPKEFTTPEAIAKGANVIAEVFKSYQE